MQYPGGKGKCFQHIINVLPEHTTYIETHLGGGAVLRHKAAAASSIGIDVDPRVVCWWRDHHPGLATYVEGDALTFLQSYRFDGGEVIYCDPPYLPSTRKRQRVYRYDLTEDDHLKLLATLKSLPCRIVISGYPSTLYRTRLKDWTELTFPAKAQDGLRQECLWINFSLPCCLHDVRYLGHTFRERQDIKRRMHRLRSKIAALSSPEQHDLASWLARELTSTGEF